MLWVLKRRVSMRRFFWAPKTYRYVKIDGLENIYNFTLKIFVYLNLLGILEHLPYVQDVFFCIFSEKHKEATI